MQRILKLHSCKRVGREVKSKETKLERVDFTLQLSMFVTAEKERRMFTIFFLSSFCQLLSPRIQARTGWVRPVHEISDQPAWKAALSNVVSLVKSKVRWAVNHIRHNICQPFFIQQRPDEPFHKFRASISGDWRVLCNSGRSVRRTSKLQSCERVSWELGIFLLIGRWGLVYMSCLGFSTSPDRNFHNFRAWRSKEWQILCSWKRFLEI